MKTYHSTSICLCLLIFAVTRLNAQHAVVSAGGDINNASGSVSYTIGEAVYTDISGLTGSSDQGVQQPDVNIALSIKVLLSGPFNSTSGLMNDQLRSTSLIASNEPYSSAPFNKPAILETNNESLPSGVFLNSTQDAIVDWVFIELRDATNPNIILATKRALLQRDGDVVSHLDATSPVVFIRPSSGNYYVSVKHRNHLGVMTASPVSLTQSSMSIDFTTMSTVYLKPGVTTNTPRRTEGNVFTLWPGDANNNKNTKYNGLTNDKDEVLSAVGGIAYINGSIDNTYRVEDLNLDGSVRYNNANNDRVVILNAVGVTTPNKVLNQHTPN